MASSSWLVYNVPEVTCLSAAEREAEPGAGNGSRLSGMCGTM